jgi:hypothetical protein
MLQDRVGKDRLITSDERHGSTFPAHLATEWLREEFDWQDVKLVLQELVQAGVLRIERVEK